MLAVDDGGRIEAWEDRPEDRADDLPEERTDDLPDDLAEEALLFPVASSLGRFCVSLSTSGDRGRGGGGASGMAWMASGFSGSCGPYSIGGGRVSRVSDWDRERDRVCERVVARIARAAKNGVNVARLSFSKVEGPPSCFDMMCVTRGSPGAEKPG